MLETETIELLLANCSRNCWFSMVKRFTCDCNCLITSWHFFSSWGSVCLSSTFIFLTSSVNSAILCSYTSILLIYVCSFSFCFSIADYQLTSLSELLDRISEMILSFSFSLFCKYSTPFIISMSFLLLKLSKYSESIDELAFSIYYWHCLISCSICWILSSLKNAKSS